MGKQRYWSTGNGRTTTTNSSVHHHQSSSSSTSAGCMCAVFQLFDFHPLNQHHHHQVPPQSPKPISPPLDDDPISKGTEAPRNSLESDEEESPFSCTPKQKEDGLHFPPKGIVKIKTKSGMITRGSSANKENCFSGNSPSTKTPTLVARLMGLDLLPQSINDSPSTTPRSASSPKTLVNKQSMVSGGSRSLPETPRTSCERKSNVEINYHHRLSLQIPNNYDKENSNTPSSNYAKEIVKQIKESVSRKAGLSDITNYTRRDQEVILQTKPRKVLSSSSSSSSPKSSNVEAIGPRPKPKPKQKVKTKVELKKKKEEAFVSPSRITKAAIDSPINNLKKTKKTPLSNQLLSFGSVPTSILMKKEPSFSSPIKPTPLQSPCNENQGADETDEKESKRSNHQPHIPITLHHQHVIKLPPNNFNTITKHHIRTTAAAVCRNNHLDSITAELEYVRQILLRRTTSSSVSSSVFLEYNNVPHRKLLCHLVEELLKPYLEVTPFRLPAAERWPDLVEKLCEEVRKLPRARCEVLEDIDGIVEKDMDSLGIKFEEESEGIAKEIEECILEEILKETVRFVEEVRDGVV